MLFSALASWLGIVQLSDSDGEILTGEKLQVDLGSFGGRGGRGESRSYKVYDGVAILPVSGSLVHKSGHLNPYSGMTGYDGIIARAANAFADPEVNVLMYKDTPGGKVSGFIDQNILAKQLDVSPSTLSRVLKGQSSVSPEMALRLSKALGHIPESWLAMQDSYDLWRAKQSVNLERVNPVDFAAA